MSFSQVLLATRNIYEHAERLISRPPIVTIMGHVDHGKTTLLDSLRSSRIVDSEFGGITQHLGAFKVSLSDVSGKVYDAEKRQIVTFLDTPGHAAFSAMRCRGANCTDIVILVVAIEDGIMPQTLESIRFAKEAKVPIIVAINKVDRVWRSLANFQSSTNKDPFKSIFHSLSQVGVVVEEYGGTVQCVPISALKKWNLDMLQESVLALAEVLNIRSDFEGPCESVVLEANIVDGLGKVATVLVQQGRMKCGSILVAGDTYVKVRTIKSEKGDSITEANPGDPVEVTGWKGCLPKAGDVMIEVNSESRANGVLQYRKKIVNEKRTEADFEQYEQSMASYQASYKRYVQGGLEKGYRIIAERPRINDYLHNERLKNGIEIPQVNVIIKTDVQGSLEAIESVMEAASKSCADQCLIKVAQKTVGNITENDLELAVSSNSIIYLFNLPQSFGDNRKSGVDIRHFNVIYHLFDDLKEHIAALLPTISDCEIFGEAEVLQMFDISEKNRKIPVCGSKCFKGALHKNHARYRYRIIRPSKEETRTFVTVRDELQCRSLRHLKSDVDTIRRGSECGIILVDQQEEFVTTEVGDIVQCYTVTAAKQSLVWDLGFQ